MLKLFTDGFQLRTGEESEEPIQSTLALQTFFDYRREALINLICEEPYVLLLHRPYQQFIEHKEVFRASILHHSEIPGDQGLVHTEARAWLEDFAELEHFGS